MRNCKCSQMFSHCMNWISKPLRNVVMLCRNVVKHWWVSAAHWWAEAPRLIESFSFHSFKSLPWSFSAKMNRNCYSPFRNKTSITTYSKEMMWIIQIIRWILLYAHVNNVWHTLYNLVRSMRRHFPLLKASEIKRYLNVLVVYWECLKYSDQCTRSFSCISPDTMDLTSWFDHFFFWSF